MESLSKKRLALSIHFDGKPSKQTSVYVTDKANSLESFGAKLDFYLHGEKLDLARTFEEQNVASQSIIHTAEKARPVFEFDPICFKFLNGTVIELPVPKVWTFQKAAEVIGASNGIEVKRICLLFEGRKMDPRLAFMDEKQMVREAVITVVVMGDLPNVT